MNNFINICALVSILFACQNTNRPEDTALKTSALANDGSDIKEKSDKIYQYSIWRAFINLIYDGEITINELKQHGNIGLGSYSTLSGELVMVDGKPYKIPESGNVEIASDDETLAFTTATYFDNDTSFNLSGKLNPEELESKLDETLPSQNEFYAFKIHGTFETIKLGGIAKQEKPYEKGLDELIPERPTYEATDIAGTIVGFYEPEFVGDLGSQGYHFHFISDNEEYGGHLMEFSTSALEVQVDKITGFTFDLPETEAYRNVELDKEFQYSN